MMQFPGGNHLVDELCGCQPSVEIDADSDSIVVHHRCTSIHPEVHNWVAVKVNLLGDDNSP
jgi:hypothetical protein